MFSQKLLSALLLTSVLGIGFASAASNINTQAAGVAVSVTPSTANVSATGNITLAYTSTVSVPTTGSIRVRITTGSGYTGTPTFTINTISASSTSSVAGNVTTYTLTPGATVGVGAVSIVISGLTTPTTQGNYAFIVSSSTGDFGAAFQYVGQANVVNVTAEVPNTLSFSIRNSADTANTNLCDLGILDTASVASCDYRLKVATNAANGYTISVSTSGSLSAGSNTFTDAAAGTAGSAITAGTPMYGAYITAGSLTSGASATLATAYNVSNPANVAAYNTTSAQLLLTAAGVNAPAASADTTNTTLVTHRAAIGSGTAAGIYTQTVTYTVSANF